MKTLSKTLFFVSLIFLSACASSHKRLCSEIEEASKTRNYPKAVSAVESYLEREKVRGDKDKEVDAVIGGLEKCGYQMDGVREQLKQVKEAKQ